MGSATMLVGLGVGVIILVVVIAVAAYVLNSISHMKALKALGYDKAWLAWIPYGVYFACADVVTNGEEPVRLFDKFEVPAIVFRHWWIVPVAFLFIPLNETLVNVINFVLNLVFLGCSYAKMYARLEGKQENETQVIGCVSGVFPIVAIVKFLMLK